MLHKVTFAVIGGDLRQTHLAGLLADDGYTVFTVGFDRDVEISQNVLRMKSAAEAVAKSDCVVLPLPYSLDGKTVNAPFARSPIPLEEIWNATGSRQLVTGGLFSKDVYECARTHKFRAVDYYTREELAILNTIPTAEGAIQIAMEELPITIYGAKCLVMGFGRVGKTLCRDLSALGAQVTACARKYADLAWVRALGYTPLPLHQLETRLANFDIIYNTVPAVLFTERMLSGLKKNCLVIDLASKPGGVDFETARSLDIKAIWALSLPGKVAPNTSGGIIRDTVLNILAELQENANAVPEEKVLVQSDS